ncbi:MAG: nitroreductase family protein [Candidatus Sumerlaeia bacterium]
MDVMEAIRKRRSVRDYEPRPIPREVLESVTEALRLAPSACNFQPWRFVIVTDPDVRGRLAAACRNQRFIAEAPVIVAGCALTDESYTRMGGYWNSCDIDVAIALDHLTLAAAGAGLGTCWIGAFSEKDVKEVLGIPKNAKPIGLIVMGYPREGVDLPATPRKSRDQVFGENKF